MIMENGEQQEDLIDQIGLLSKKNQKRFRQAFE